METRAGRPAGGFGMHPAWRVTSGGTEDGLLVMMVPTVSMPPGVAPSAVGLVRAEKEAVEAV